MNRTLIHSYINHFKKRLESTAEIQSTNSRKTSKFHPIASEHKNKHSKIPLQNHGIRLMISDHLISL